MNHSTVHLDANSFTDDLVCNHWDRRVSVRVVDGDHAVWVCGNAESWRRFRHDAKRIYDLAIEELMKEST